MEVLTPDDHGGNKMSETNLDKTPAFVSGLECIDTFKTLGIDLQEKHQLSPSV